MSVKALPFLSDDTCVSTTACTYFGYTGLPATDPIITELTGFFTASEPKSVVPKFYTDEAAMTAAYDASPKNFVVGVVFLGPSTNLTTPPTAGGSAADLYQYTILANHTSYSNSEYLNSRFATAQVQHEYLHFVNWLSAKRTRIRLPNHIHVLHALGLCRACGNQLAS